MVSLPDGFLAGSSELQTFSLLSNAIQQLPTDFLASARHLRELSLKVPRLVGPPPRFLTQSLALNHLEIGLSLWPAGFLEGHPSQETLQLRLREKNETPPGFLNHLPNLKDIVLSAGINTLGTNFLAHNPSLEKAEFNSLGLDLIKSGFLVDSKNLRNVFINSTFCDRYSVGYSKLKETRPTSLPPDFLATAPSLEIF